jgi:uncharacterized protein (DUF433 family)
MNPDLVKRDPEIMSGALCFSGTRVPVKNLFDYLEGSSSLEEFLEDFPTVSRIRAVAVLEAAVASGFDREPGRLVWRQKRQTAGACGDQIRRVCHGG